MNKNLFFTLLTTLLTTFSTTIFGQTPFVHWNFGTNQPNANYTTNYVNQNSVRLSDISSKADISNFVVTGGRGLQADSDHRSSGWPVSRSENTYMEFSITAKNEYTFENDVLKLDLSTLVDDLTTSPRNILVKYRWGTTGSFSNAGQAITGINDLTTGPTLVSRTIARPGNVTTQKLTIRLHVYGGSTGIIRVRDVKLTSASDLKLNVFDKPVVKKQTKTDFAYGTLMRDTFQASNFPTSWNISAEDQAVLQGYGILIDTKTGALSGQVSEVGSTTISVSATNVLGQGLPELFTFNFIKANQVLIEMPNETKYGFVYDLLELPNTTINESNTSFEANTISYTSSNPDVAIVSGGQLLYLSEGVATISYVINDELSDYYNSNLENGEFEVVVSRKEQRLDDLVDLVKVYGDNPIELPLTTNDGVVLSYSTSDASVATIEGNILTINGAGEAIINASNEGDIEFLPFETSVNLVVKQADQKILPALTDISGYIYDEVNLPKFTVAGDAITYSKIDGTAIDLVANKIINKEVGSGTVKAVVAENRNYKAYESTFTVTVSNPYAVAGEYKGEGIFALVTKVTDLVDGYYVITNETSEYLMSIGRNNNETAGYFLPKLSNVDNRNLIVNPLITNVWEIKSNGNGRTISNATTGTELFVSWATGDGVTLANALTDNTKWTFNFQNGKFTVNNIANSSKQLSYDASLSGFAAFDNGNKQALKLFKLTNTTIWDGQTWSIGEPNSTLEAILMGDLVNASSYIKAKNIKVGKDVIVPSGTVLEVEENIEVADNFKLTFEPEAYFLQNNADAINVGNVVYKVRSQNMMRNDMSHWSSPVIGQHIRAFSPGTLYNRFWTYNENTSLYKTIFSSNTATDKLFEAGKGIAMRVKFDIPADYNEPTIGEFNGQLFNGDLTVSVTKNKDGYNLIGNPYPSPIGITEFFEENTDVEKIFIWTPYFKVGSADFDNNYITITKAGTISPREGAIVMNEIAAGQGFFVQTANQGIISFNNSMRKANPTAFQRVANENNRYWIGLSKGNSKSNQILVSYDSESTNGVDHQYDAESVENGATRLYSLIEGKKYSIQSRLSHTDVNEAVILGYTTDESGRLTLDIDQLEGVFNNGETVYLNDKDLNIQHDLTSSSYTFDTTAGEFNDRFEIVYASKSLSTTPEVTNSNEVKVYQTGNLTYVVSDNGLIDSIDVVDVSGRLIKSDKSLNQNKVQLNLTSGVYYLKIKLNTDKIISVKALVK